ncbi:hypothetical protein GZH47_32965 (plasmid) [Paenibacillus rhizovicinus]|uniref:Uncharacterized protein n=1 Tax=Paenibacillus rhizovicinus TaxID=2704463 RepID=A0A6C0PB89_9BACL|nr:hypothetical protein [Paenibacillus rhizovicinus]QHW35706.1 hypothetical protein GZH47_32965 [Paenibacillus rhizovicinus]
MELVAAYASCEVKGVKLFAGDFISFTFLGAGELRGFFRRVDMSHEVFKYLVVDDDNNGIPHHYQLPYIYGIEVHPVPSRYRR